MAIPKYILFVFVLFKVVLSGSSPSQTSPSQQALPQGLVLSLNHPQVSLSLENPVQGVQLQNKDQHGGVTGEVVMKQSPNLLTDKLTTLFNYLQHLLDKDKPTTTHINTNNRQSQADQPLPKTIQPQSNQQNQRNLASTFSKQPSQLTNTQESSNDITKPQETIQQQALLNKKNKRKYFILGTIVFGLIAMAAVKIVKRKEEESQDFHRSGMLVPHQETQTDHQ